MHERHEMSGIWPMYSYVTSSGATSTDIRNTWRYNRTKCVAGTKIRRDMTVSSVGSSRRRESRFAFRGVFSSDGAAKNDGRNYLAVERT